MDNLAKHSLSSGARCVSGGRATETQVNFASRCSVGTPSGGRFSGFPNGRPVRVNVTSLLVLIGDYAFFFFFKRRFPCGLVSRVSLQARGSFVCVVNQSENF